MVQVVLAEDAFRLMLTSFSKSSSWRSTGKKQHNLKVLKLVYEIVVYIYKHDLTSQDDIMVFDSGQTASLSSSSSHGRPAERD